jgi:glyoxylase-like metal-dependent hydrolase (beta-lactamase superfamily II)
MVLGTLIAAGALSLTVAAYQQPPAGGGGRGQQAPRVVEVEKLKENLFILRGGGGNTAVFVQANGVTVVDTKNPGWGQPILDKIKELTPKPVTMIINTHTHGDHVSGNVEFPATVDVVVHENTAANMKVMAPVTGLQAPVKPGEKPPPTIFDQNQGRGLPKRTFKDRMTIGKGPDQIDLYYFGRGHTNGDAWVLFPALRVVHAGDIFASNNGLPILDANNGGSGLEIPDTLMKAHAALIKSADSIITGHSTVMNFNDLRVWADFNRDFLNQAREAKKAGRTPEEVAKAWKAPANFTVPATEAAQKAAMTRLQANVQTIFNEIK